LAVGGVVAYYAAVLLVFSVFLGAGVAPSPGMILPQFIATGVLTLVPMVVLGAFFGSFCAAAVALGSLVMMTGREMEPTESNRLMDWVDVPEVEEEE